MSARSRALCALLFAFSVVLGLPALAAAATTPACSDVTRQINGDTEWAQYVTLDCSGPRDAESYSITIVEDGAKGSVSYAYAGTSDSPSGVHASAYYLPQVGHRGLDSFKYKLTVDGVESNVATATVYTAAPGTPSCNSGPTRGVRTNSSTRIYLSCSYVMDDTTQAIEITDAPDHGKLEATYPGSSEYRYTPDADYSGPDSFKFRKTSKAGDSYPTEQRINVDPDHNTAPSCYAYSPYQVRSNWATKVSFSCSDDDGDAVTVSTETAPQYGSLGQITTQGSPYVNGSVAYTSEAAYTGMDEFTLKASDGRGSSTFKKTIEVMGPDFNNKPTCSTTPAREVTSGAQVNEYVWCSDADGDPLTFSKVDGPTNGTLTGPTTTSSPWGTSTYFSYTSAAGYIGADSWSWKANDGRSDSDVVKVDYTVSGPKAPVCSTPPQVSLRPGSTRYFSFWCSSSTGGQQSVEIVTPPAYGKLVKDQWDGGGYRYTADAVTAVTADEFSYRVSNSAGASNTVTQKITIDPDANAKPSCSVSSTTIRSGVKKRLSIYCWDEDYDKITATLGTAPTRGTLGALVKDPWGSGYYADYTSETGFVGTDSFTLSVNDGRTTAASQQYVQVRGADYNTKPVCSNYWGDGGREVEAGFAVNEGPSCYDPDGDALTYKLGDVKPAHGTVEGPTTTNGWTRFVYTPASDYEGTDSWSYVANDGFADSDPVVLEYAITKPQPPQCEDPGAITMRPGATKYIWTECTSSQNGGQQTIEVVDAPANGEIDTTSLWGFRYTAAPGTPDGTTDSFTWRVTDAVGTSNLIKQTVTITSAANDPAECWGYTGTVRSGSPKKVTVGCWDSDGDPVTVGIGAAPANGTLGSLTKIAVEGAEDYNEYEVTYTPKAGYVGPDSFKITGNDGRGTTTSTVYIDVKDADYNQAPECWGGGSRQVTNDRTLDLWLPCYDYDGDELKTTISDGPDHGTLSEPDARGTRTYTPQAGYVGQDEITYSVTDERSEPVDVTVEIKVVPPADIAPQPVVNPTTGATVNVNTYKDPDTGLDYITVPNGQVSQFENACMPLSLDVPITTGAGTVTNAMLVLEPADGSEEKSTTLTDANGDKKWAGTIECVKTGDLFVEYDLTEDGVTEHLRIPLGGLVLIDPQGVVHDKVKYDAAIAAGKTPTEARSAAAITGATVRLQRKVDGEWRSVLSGDPGITPNVNPQVTDSDGLFQWDVSAGTYRVVVTKEGCKSVTSEEKVIPPPVLDLHIAMDCGTVIPPVDNGNTSTGNTTGNTAGTSNNTTGSSTSGTQDNPTVQPPTADPYAKCKTLKGTKRAACIFEVKELAKCGKLKGKKKGVCTKRARALAKCQTKKGKQKTACVRKAKKIKK